MPMDAYANRVCEVHVHLKHHKKKTGVPRKKGPLLLSIESWLVNRDPYSGL